MKIQNAPMIATWLLKLFCGVDDESLIGDLLEKYQQGRGRLWYWRQVAGILIFRLSKTARQLSLVEAAMRLRQSLPLLLVIAAFTAVLLSDIWVILPLGLLGGILAAVLISFLSKRPSEQRHPPLPIGSQYSGSTHPGISMNHIPVEGSVGLLFVVGTVLIFGAGVPAIRQIFFFIVPLAVFVWGILRYWYKDHSVKIEAIDLHNHRSRRS